MALIGEWWPLLCFLLKLQICAMVSVYDLPEEDFRTKWSVYLTTNKVTSHLDSLPKSQGNFPFKKSGTRTLMETQKQ